MHSNFHCNSCLKDQSGWKSAEQLGLHENKHYSPEQESLNINGRLFLFTSIDLESDCYLLSLWTKDFRRLLAHSHLCNVQYVSAGQLQRWGMTQLCLIILIDWIFFPIQVGLVLLGITYTIFSYKSICLVVYSSNNTFGLKFFTLVIFSSWNKIYFFFGSNLLFWNRDLLYSRNDASYQGKLLLCTQL